MMCRTHFVVGTAAAICLTGPQDLRGYLTAVLGGTVGSLISDLDQPSTRVARDTAWNRKLLLCMLGGVLVADQIFGTGLWAQIQELSRTPRFLGAVVFLALCFGMPFSAHRGFSHSILALLLMTGAARQVSVPLSDAFFWGFVSHLALDLLNKRGMKLLFPWKKGFCLGWCYANGKTAKVLTEIALVVISVCVAADVVQWLEGFT